MVKSNRYSPTNKKFKSHFENFASEKTKKGHLNKNDRDADDTTILTGILKRINRKKLYDNGWEVEVDKKIYYCTYSTNVMSIPTSTVTDTYFIPKNKCEVEIQVDKVSKIYTISRIKDVNLTPIALYDNVVTISSNTNTNTNNDSTASISVTRTGVNLSGEISISDDVTIKGNVSSPNITMLEEKISNLESQINSDNSLQQEIIELRQQIKEIQSKTEGDNNDG